MIDNIYKNYGIKVEEYTEYKNGILFFVDGYRYYFTETSFRDEELLNIYEMSKYLTTKGVRLHEFVVSSKQKICDEGFVLLKLVSFVDDINLDDLSNFNILLNEFSSQYIKMEKFWEDKIDYIEYQLNELSCDKMINNSFDYFLGVGELLLAFYKDNYIYDDNVYLVHRRMTDLSSIDFFNPLNVTLGCKWKDYISYIKCTNDLELLSYILDSVNNNDKIYLFVRMCFPYIYFDLVNEIFSDNKENTELLDIVNHVLDYELFLSKMEKLFGISIFSWIKKE